MKALMTLIFLAVSLLANAQEWQSGPKSIDFIELYTSEGCSSCPPADHWISMLKNEAGVFESFMPVVFHVDYWDYLGWKDRFARNSFSERQRQYVREGLVSQVYTPGLVVNSQEWRRWFRGDREWPMSRESAGVLKVSLEGNKLTADFDQTGAATLHVAYLGMGLLTEVKAGENHGRTLGHDFVVLDIATVQGEQRWQLTLPAKPDKGQARTALAVWVSPANSQKVLQATGGYID